MADEITERHLQRLRIRGAPSTIPGTVGFVGSYEAEETWRQTARALVTPVEKITADVNPLSPPRITARTLAAAFDRLNAVGTSQSLAVVEEPMFALKGDPTEDPPHKWEYEAILPFRGAGKGDGDVQVSRVQGGMHIFTLTPRGLGDLRNVYVYLFGKFMPAKKQQLMRPYILHRVVEGSVHGPHAHEDALTIAVYVPAVLSIKPVVIPGESGEAS